MAALATLLLPVRHPGAARLSPLSRSPTSGDGSLRLVARRVPASTRLGSLITWGSIPAALAGKGLLLLAAPLLLYATGFFEHGETTRLKALVAGFRRGAGRPGRAWRAGNDARPVPHRRAGHRRHRATDPRAGQAARPDSAIAPVVCCFRPGRVSPGDRGRRRPRVHAAQARRSSTSRLVAGSRPAHAAGADRPRADLPLHREHVGTAGREPRGRPDHRHLGAERRHVGGAVQAASRPVWLDRWTQRTIGNSQAVKDYLVRKGIAPDKVARDLQRRRHQPLRGARHAGVPHARSSASPRITRWSASSPGSSRRRTPRTFLRRGGHRRAEAAERVRSS